MLMKSSHVFLTITLLLGIGMCGLVYRVMGATVEESAAARGAAPAKQAGAATPGTAEIAELRQEMVRLKLQMRTQDRRLAATDLLQAEAKDPVATGDLRIDPEARAERRRSHGEYVASVATTFGNEGTDSQWSSIASSTIQTAMAGDNDLSSFAHRVECRSHTCRLEIADDGSGKLGKLLPIFVHQVGRELPSVVADRVEGAGGVATMVLYLSRRDESQTIAP
jgi:hypothetical protein